MKRLDDKITEGDIIFDPHNGTKACNRFIGYVIKNIKEKGI